MHKVWLDVVKQTLIVRHNNEAALPVTLTVYTIGNHLQGVNIQARVRLVKNTQRRLKQDHLHDLVTLLLTAGEAFVHTTL